MCKINVILGMNHSPKEQQIIAKHPLLWENLKRNILDKTPECILQNCQCSVEYWISIRHIRSYERFQISKAESRDTDLTTLIHAKLKSNQTNLFQLNFE